MELINVKNKTELTLLLGAAKKLGISAKKLTPSQLEDWALGKKIDTGMKTSYVSRSETMKALGYDG